MKIINSEKIFKIKKKSIIFLFSIIIIVCLFGNSIQEDSNDLDLSDEDINNNNNNNPNDFSNNNSANKNLNRRKTSDSVDTDINLLELNNKITNKKSSNNLKNTLKNTLKKNTLKKQIKPDPKNGIPVKELEDDVVPAVTDDDKKSDVKNVDKKPDPKEKKAKLQKHDKERKETFENNAREELNRGKEFRTGDPEGIMEKYSRKNMQKKGNNNFLSFLNYMSDQSEKIYEANTKRAKKIADSPQWWNSGK